ncbi:transcription factor E2F7 isoform 1-T3 [Menidia menidia]
MEVECLALRDLTSSRRTFSVEPEEDECQSEQKENMHAERRRSTPLRTAESTVPASVSRKDSTPDLAHTTPMKQAGVAEPWTPTANLKMLISAASPEIHNREMKKVLFRPIENEKSKPSSPEDTEVEDSCQFEAADEEEDAEKKPSRKQKSLGLLCQKFLALYPDYPPLHSPIWISLDEVATSLGVERRRIYDIVNVLESLMIVGRIAKNSYTWYGRQRLQATLEDLQCKGREQGYHLQVDLAADTQKAGHSHEEDGGEADAGIAAGNRKDKSLRIMSQKFVMLFLVSRTQIVTLDAAAKILIEESQDSSSHSKYKTKVRRLYDIANVLTSLNLIKKIHVREERGRKPAFKWLGPVEFSNSGNALHVAAVSPADPAIGHDPKRAKMARHASFNAPPAHVATQRLVSSAPSSPGRHPGLLNQPADYSTKPTQSRTNCGLQSENNSDSKPHEPSQLEPLILSSPHCLAYLPNLSQPSVVMLYRAPEGPELAPVGQRSPEVERKRRREASEEEEMLSRKKQGSGLEESCQVKADPQAGCPHLSSTRTSSALLNERVSAETHMGNGGEHVPPSHYLYIPNHAGLSNLNFINFIPAGQPPAVALPYVLVPSAALSHYPLLASGVQHQGSDRPANMTFTVPAMMPPTHFMVGATPYAAAPETGSSALPSPATPKQQHRPCVSAASAPHSPPGPQRVVSTSTSTSTPEPLTPNTPKETTSSSKAFFQTPGTLGNAASSVQTSRKRGSAQRRLDIGHPPAELF